MKNIVIVYPNQLFEINNLPYDIKKMDIIILFEEPLFFKDTDRQLKFNMLKLIYQRATMKYYYSYLKTYHKNVIYLDYQKSSLYPFKYISEKYKDYKIHIVSPTDHLLMSRIQKYKPILYENPLFLTTEKELAQYMETKKTKTFSQYHFYIWQRKRTNILMKDGKPIGGSYSYDSENRKSIPNKNFIEFAKDNNINIKHIDYNQKNKLLIKNAINYCENTFINYYPQNYDSSKIYLYPLTHDDANKHFKHFIKHKLKYFGDYQDAMDTSDYSLFHSVISPQLNNGLISPKTIQKLILNYKITDNKNLFNIEGFLRQLNWREYSRLLYIYAYDKMKKNYFKNNKSITANWYTGKTGILPVDHTIKQAFKYGYLHHIQRLMIMCNFMNLCQIKPDHVYNWFMEFSLDSYDWVMINNVYSMGLYADGGLTTTKPYISTSNYILKLSNFKNNDDTWIKSWTILYYYFIYKKYNKFKGRGKIYASQWTKLKNKSFVKKEANKILKKL